MAGPSPLTYAQLQFTAAALIGAVWFAIELVPERLWTRGREPVTRAARYVGGTVLATAAMIYLRRNIAAAPKPEMWAVFAIVVAGASLLLTRASYLRRFVPRAGPDELGVLRCVLGLILTFLVVREDLQSTLLIPDYVVRKSGLIWWLQIKGGSAAWLLDIRNPIWLRVVSVTALVSGILTMVGLLTRAAVPILVLSFTLFYHTLCSYSHFFHVGLVPLLILGVLIWFPTNASFSLDAVIRRRRNRPAIEAPPEVWAWGVYSAWLIYGLAYWAAGASKLAQPRAWGMQTLRYYAVRDSDILLEFDWDITQRLVAANVDEWVFGPAAVAVLVFEVAAIWVLFSTRARKWIPPIMVSFHLGVIALQGIVFFDLILIPLAFIPARSYRRIASKLGLGSVPERTKPEIEQVVARRDRNLARVLLVAMLPGLVATGWMFRRERFPFMTRWGMFETAFEAREVMSSFRLYAVYADGHRERSDLTKEIRALNNTRYRDNIGWPSGRGNPKARKRSLTRMQGLLNAAGAAHNEGLPEAEWIVSYELEAVRWRFEKDRDDPNWGTAVATMSFVVGDEVHPEIAGLDRLIERERARKRKQRAAKSGAAATATKSGAATTATKPRAAATATKSGVATTATKPAIPTQPSTATTKPSATEPDTAATKAPAPAPK